MLTPPVVSGARPLLGHLLEFRRDRAALFRRAHAERGEVFAIKLGRKPAAVLLGPEAQKTFFTRTDHELDMAKPYAFLRAMFGAVAFVADHATYLKHRPVMQEPFKRHKMARYVTVMREQVQAWLDGLGESGEIDIVEEILGVVKDVAGHAFLGAQAQAQIGPEFWDLYAVLSKALDPILPPRLPLPKFIRRDRAKKRMRAILSPVIAERRAHPDAYDDFLQDLVTKEAADGTVLEADVITNMLIALMFAGHETTAGQAAWTLIHVAQAPELVARLRDELAAIDTVDEAALARLPLLENVVREVERMRPSADMLLREAAAPIEIGELTIPKGWLVLTASGTSHRLPAVFQDPDRFDPDRFDATRAEHKQHRFALIGFGGGMHRCTGVNFAYNEMMVIAALVFQQLDLEVITADPQVDYSLGASRPKPTRVRYRRRTLSPTSARTAAAPAADPG